MLRAVASAPTFAIFADEVHEGVLRAKIDFVNRAADQAGATRPSVVRFVAPAQFSYEHASTVFKILRRMHVDFDDIAKHAEAISYFGPLALPSLLADLAFSKSDVSAIAALVDEGALTSASMPAEKDEESDSKGKGARADSTDSADGVGKAGVSELRSQQNDDDIIVCVSEARTKVVAAAAAAADLPYVSFKIIFAEGNLYGLSIAQLREVTPAWISLGDYDNIFSIVNLADSQSSFLGMEYASSKATVLPADGKGPGDVINWEGERSWEGLNDEKFKVASTLGGNHSSLVCCKLMMAPEPDTASTVARHCISNYSSRDDDVGIDSCLPRKLVVLPGGDNGVDEDDDSSGGGGGGGGGDGGSPRSLFHRDSTGRTCFSRAEAEDASEHITAMQLDRRVEAR